MTRKSERGSSRREPPAREAAAVDRKENERSVRIQDEPESTFGRKPGELEHPERPEHGRH